MQAVQVWSAAVVQVSLVQFAMAVQPAHAVLVVEVHALLTYWPAGHVLQVEQAVLVVAVHAPD